ncbi:MAG: prepilin-type N-terminal cleavage/methylation domain-containing protein [Planctomycetia bacterium]|nr:prepilin-type N-terminal cleavage/methylation domain-containing protein [Planctomycetia bacterium]
MNDEWKNAPRGFSSHSSFIIHYSSLPSPPAARQAFTLIELMVTIIIIAILAALFLGALQQAQQAANIANTQSLINKLHAQIMLRYESYRTRRLPIDTSGLTTQQAAAHRLHAMRELMRMELPDRWTDVEISTLAGRPQVRRNVNNTTTIATPAVCQTYYRRWKDLRTQSNGAFPTAQYEDAECLYMIITTGHSDDVAGNEQFRDGDIGDADGDGAPEFHDAWGSPIRFLRWAPGFVSDVQPQDPIKNHDPFDPLKLQMSPLTQTSAYALFPLIYSAGPDRASDIQHPPVDAQGFAKASATFNFTLPNAIGYSFLIYDPFNSSVSSVGGPFDDDGDGQDGSADNIHNHTIGVQ